MLSASLGLAGLRTTLVEVRAIELSTTKQALLRTGALYLNDYDFCRQDNRVSPAMQARLANKLITATTT
jgi:hypothetical protein